MTLEYTMECTKTCPIHSTRDLTLVTNPEGSYHYGKWICDHPDHCKVVKGILTQEPKFIVWAKKPQNLEAQKDFQNQIRAFLREHFDELDEDDLHHLLDMYARYSKLSLIQQQRWENLNLKFKCMT